MLINDKIAVLCQQTEQYYFGSRESMPSRMLQSSKCVSLAYPEIRSQFNYQKDYKLASPNILYSILHEINDYKVLTIPIPAISGSKKMSRIVIANRASTKKYIASFVSLGLCVHAMCDIWHLMLLGARKLLPQAKLAWVIVSSEWAVYLFYFKQSSIYLHLSFEHDSLNEIAAAVSGFKKDFSDISTEAWCVGSLSLELKQHLQNAGLLLKENPAISKLSFERLCCMGAIAYMDKAAR